LKEFIKNKLKSYTKLNNRNVAGGVLIKCLNTDKVLLLLRSDIGDEPNTWSLVSGNIESTERILDGIEREVKEEINIDPNYITYKFKHKEVSLLKNLDFYYYEGYVEREFKPTLNNEHLDYIWCNLNTLPQPLFPGTLNKITKILQ
tara:strand:+ start:749 stop:1186 length:438 start_codon:yes stop_codon:yes gene_type:complete